MGAFKKYICSKFPVLDPLSFPFVLHVLSFQCMFALVSYLTLSQKIFCSVIAEPTLQTFMNFQMSKKRKELFDLKTMFFTQLYTHGQ